MIWNLGMVMKISREDGELLRFNGRQQLTRRIEKKAKVDKVKRMGHG